MSVASFVPPAHLVEAYRHAETRGFGEIWVHEDYFFHGGFAAAALALQATQRIPVGIGIVSTMVRHPVITAMEIATLAGAHPGRLRVGVGHGATHAIKQLGLHPKSSLAALTEVLTSVRRLLAGETLTQTGLFTYEGVQLAYPVDDVPLYAGVIGPKSLALSGEIADGTVVTVMSGPRYVEKARAITADAAARAGRTSAHALPTLTLCFVDRDATRARTAARSVIAQFIAMVGPDIVTSLYGIDDQIRDMLARGGAEALAAEMPEEWIDWFAAAGDPDQCLERILALGKAGATSVVLTLMDAGTLMSSIDLVADHVLPALR